MTRAQRTAAMRERILSTAGQLFYARGVLATGVDAIAAEMGISKRTLYNHFPSKDALILAYLDGRFDATTITDDPPVAQILGDFDRIGQMVERGRFRGCPFMKTATEVGNDHPASALATRFKAQRRARITRLLEHAGVEAADTLAVQIALLLEGAMVTAAVTQDATFLETAREAARTLITVAHPEGLGTTR